jgi:hypothetical protein
MDYIAHYLRAKVSCDACLYGYKDSGGELIMWMMGYADNWMEMQILEEEIMELGRS